MSYRTLDAQKIIATAELLKTRISERFPQAGLAAVGADIVQVARATEKQILWIRQPHLALRSLIAFTIIVAIILLYMIVREVRFLYEAPKLADFIQMTEAAVNELILFSAGLYFLISLERRIKRFRALKALHELRSLMHVIDMHQLTKDPARIFYENKRTASSPEHNLSPFELCRYLDYCAELLAILGKVAALYAQDLEDPVILSAVDELESLGGMLSSKIWQKIIVTGDHLNPAGQSSQIAL